jgi:hypothetical protein
VTVNDHRSRAPPHRILVCKHDEGDFFQAQAVKIESKKDKKSRKKAEKNYPTLEQELLSKSQL